MVKVSLDDVEDAFQEPEDRMLEIKVMDTGKGISEEYIRTGLFNRMSRFHFA